MTFILGLVAEPIPLEYEANARRPTGWRRPRADKLLDKYNCIGCHQVRPGVYDFKPTKDTLDALEHVYQTYETNKAKKDHVFPGHNAWTGVASPWPDRLTVLRHAGPRRGRRRRQSRSVKSPFDRGVALHQQRQNRPRHSSGRDGQDCARKT